jgi:hypothetical protein
MDQALALLCGALFTGGALYVSLVEQPARMKLPPGAAVEQFRVSYQRAAPWQAATAIVCTLCGAVASLRGGSWGWLVGAALVGLAVPFTLIVILPTNARLLETGDVSDEERRGLLRRWARLHWVRSALGAAGLVVLVGVALARR